MINLRNLLPILVCAGAFAQEAAFIAQAPPVPPAAPEPLARVRALEEREDASYRSGTRAIDRREYERAIEAFTNVITRKSSRSDGALYWKAYAENKLGRRDQALATLGQLQRENPQSRWLNDAKALEVEVRQASGKPVSPEAESDEELKLLAINGLMSNNSEQAMPLLQKILTDPKASPKVKERALFVVAQSRDAAGRDTLVRIAKGGGNPDLQLRAVEYLGMFSKGNTQALADIYSSGDTAVKRAVLHGLMLAGDSERVLNLARNEKSPELRRDAVRTLGMMRRDKTGDELVSMYASESDKSVKHAIVDGLFMQQNAKALVELARKEKDMTMKKEIVQRLALMHSKEATDYMLEVLNK